MAKVDGKDEFVIQPAYLGIFSPILHGGSAQKFSNGNKQDLT